MQKNISQTQNCVRARSFHDKRIWAGRVNLLHQTASDICATVNGSIFITPTIYYVSWQDVIFILHKLFPVRVQKQAFFSCHSVLLPNLILENKLWFIGDTLLVYLKLVVLSGGCEYVNRTCLYNTWKRPEVVLKRLCGMLNRDISSV